MDTFFKVEHIEQCNIFPPLGSAPSISLPLTLFDIPWLLFSPSQTLFFYKLPFTTSHFTTTILPILKHSLSLTLQQFYPLVGRLSLSTPHIRFTDGDSISLTVAKSNSDFNHLSGHHPRVTSEFYPLLPRLPSLDINTSVIPLLSIQLTIFHHPGVSIGIALHHVVFDQRTFNVFMKMWASISRSLIGGEEWICKSMPIYERKNLIKDPNGLKETLFRQWRDRVTVHTSNSTISSGMVRATFVVGPTDMERIKRWIIARCDDKKQSQPLVLSPYVLTCSFIWVCLVKAKLKIGQTNGVMEPTYFGFNAGAITRLNYCVPKNYFGNCVAFGRSTSMKENLEGADGIIFATTEIGRTIKELDGDILGGAERWICEWEVFFESNVHVMVVGSPKVDLYDMDFGRGRPNKIEQISIDSMKGISLIESREFKGGMEVGVVLSKNEMSNFTYLFNDGLRLFYDQDDKVLVSGSCA